MQSLKEGFGIRYFKAYQTKSSIVEPLDNEENMVKELYEREYTMAEKRYITLEQFTLGKSSMEEVMNFLNSDIDSEFLREISMVVDVYKIVLVLKMNIIY